MFCCSILFSTITMSLMDATTKLISVEIYTMEGITILVLKSSPLWSPVRVKTNPYSVSNTFFVPANSGELVRTQLRLAREILELLLNSFVIMWSKDHNNKQQYGLASRIVKFAQILPEKGITGPFMVSVAS
ncbi:PREDICTED: uncharacterized protein LOC104738705 isoform X2 [Camelina sativa]|uniref:Uncharacterized protein LOC104738705 isoform X2 n=1 Tax=Camelina sativa TaxID=90675 RepID=A0ABM0VJJ5_CAMSA|nr:PREDICTED: uncharacterized protein LOC104738705 isoform X2 [Camelina sativa]